MVPLGHSGVVRSQRLSHHKKSDSDLLSFQETAATSRVRRRRKEPTSADPTTVTATPKGSIPAAVSKPTAAEHNRTGRQQKQRRCSATSPVSRRTRATLRRTTAPCRPQPEPALAPQSERPGTRTDECLFWSVLQNKQRHRD